VGQPDTSLTADHVHCLQEVERGRRLGSGVHVRMPTG
jgi:hypothetical protein